MFKTIGKNRLIPKFTAVLMILMTVISVCPAFSVYAGNDVDWYTGSGDIISTDYWDKYTNSSYCFKNKKITVLTEKQVRDACFGYDSSLYELKLSKSPSSGHIICALDTRNLSHATAYWSDLKITYTNRSGKVFDCAKNTFLEYGYYPGLDREVFIIRYDYNTPELEYNAFTSSGARVVEYKSAYANRYPDWTLTDSALEKGLYRPQYLSYDFYYEISTEDNGNYFYPVYSVMKFTKPSGLPQGLITCYVTNHSGYSSDEVVLYF